MPLTDQQHADAAALWDYHRLGQQLRPCCAAVALGGFDLGVADYAAELFRGGYFPLVVFTGATSPATRQRFPRGEAAAFGERALALGVPGKAILLEPHAANTGENIALSRALLRRRGIGVTDLMAVCMPSMQRRAYATCATQWPEVRVVCASRPGTLDDYIRAAGSARTVVEELVGDLQRLWRYPRLGFAAKQTVPGAVVAAYHRLAAAGFDAKVLP